MQPQETSSRDVYSEVMEVVSGEEIGDVIELFAYMLADAVAQISGYTPNKEMFLEGGSMYSEAYKFVCSDDTTDTITH